MRDERKLIVANLLRGIILPSVGCTFNKTEQEIEVIFKYVLLKLKSYAFERLEPAILATDILSAQREARRLLIILEKINLDIEPVYTSVVTQKVCDQNDFRSFG